MKSSVSSAAPLCLLLAAIACSGTNSSSASNGGTTASSGAPGITSSAGAGGTSGGAVTAGGSLGAAQSGSGVSGATEIGGTGGASEVGGAGGSAGASGEANKGGSGGCDPGPNPLTSCPAPAEAPPAGTPCALTLSCPYGAQTCCGQTAPSSLLMCQCGKVVYQSYELCQLATACGGASSGGTSGGAGAGG